MFNKQQFYHALSHILFGMIGALILQVGFFHSPKKIAVVNMTGIVDSFVKETAKQSLSKAEVQEKMNHFANLLDSTLKKVSQKQHVVILPSEAVVSGALDLTDEVKTKIKEGLNR